MQVGASDACDQNVYVAIKFIGRFDNNDLLGRFNCYSLLNVASRNSHDS
jgi:hypothetical protein